MEEEFRAECNERGYGTLLDRSTLQFDDYFQFHLLRGEKIIEAIRAHPNWNNLPPIHINIIHNTQNKFGAKAFVSKKGNLFIGIFSYTIIKLHDLFNSILADKNCFHNVGDPNFDAIIINPISGKIIDPFDARFSLNHGWNKDRSPLPLDPIRMHTANILIKFAVDYIIRHEVAHHLFGHIKLIKKENLDNLSFQTLEMDADSFATNRAYWEYKYCVENNDLNQNKIDKDLHFIYKNEETAFFYWGFSIYNLLLLSDSINTGLVIQISHIPSRIRIKMILGNIFTILLKKGNGITGDYKENAVKIYLEGEKCYEQITGNKIKRDENRLALSEEISEYSNKICTNWKTIYPLLVPLSYGKLTVPE